jgi:4,5-DOPA dioxygenase extradiol
MNETVIKYPALFIGHGSPMNIVADNPFTRDIKRLGETLPLPEAILVISAHWLTHGTFVTSGEHPEQIYDFYGFPQNLYKIRYQAPGSMFVARKIIDTAGDDIIHADSERGIDHAAWSILKHIYPEQNIPVLELSLDADMVPFYHFQLGKKISGLRRNGILVIGSGNIIHNLSEIDFRDQAAPFKWATEFDSLIKSTIEAKDFQRLIEYKSLGPLSERAIPFNDHYLPMLYILGMIEQDEKIVFINDTIQNGSISMRSFITTF